MFENLFYRLKRFFAYYIYGKPTIKETLPFYVEPQIEKLPVRRRIKNLFVKIPQRVDQFHYDVPIDISKLSPPSTDDELKFM